VKRALASGIRILFRIFGRIDSQWTFLMVDA